MKLPPRQIHALRAPPRELILNIDKARDLAWVTAQTIWELRRTVLLGDRFLAALGHTVGMTSRALLTPVPELSPR